MIAEFKGEYRFLSNFCPAEIEVGGIKYPSVEHAYQAAKTKLALYKEKIAKQMTAGQAKQFAYKLPLSPEWEHVKIGVMKELLEKKFAIPELRMKLINTGTEELIEGNTWHDNFWGSCICEKCGNKGKNVLGKLLMEVRGECGI